MTIAQRIHDLDWTSLTSDLDTQGYALTPSLLSPSECEQLIALYSDDKLFRSHIIMARYRFGSGDYKYFAHPLPAIINELRTSLYPYLATVANRWNEVLGAEDKFPARHEVLLAECHQRGQARPTPLLLHYETGDYNCLHQDLYGQIAFPLQLTCFLSPQSAYTGGEFVLTEQQPRAQSRVQVVAAEQGQALIFTTRYRPVKGSRGYFRLNVRHGVSRIHSGVRYTLGVPFHDAE